MPWENTEQYIRSGHRDPEEFQKATLKTITLNKKEGIKAVVGKPKGKHTMEVARADWQRLWYDAKIYDEETAAKIRKGLIRHVSIGADYETMISSTEKFLMGYATPR